MTNEIAPTPCFAVRPFPEDGEDRPDHILCSRAKGHDGEHRNLMYAWSAPSGHGWRIGDRVSLCPTGNESDRVQGVVTHIDEPHLFRGVRVRFDHPVRGVDNCYASHDELTLIRRSADG